VAEKIKCKIVQISQKEDSYDDWNDKTMWKFVFDGMTEWDELSEKEVKDLEDWIWKKNIRNNEKLYLIKIQDTVDILPLCLDDLKKQAKQAKEAKEKRKALAKKRAEKRKETKEKNQILLEKNLLKELKEKYSE
jgi:hypothetical protein